MLVVVVRAFVQQLQVNVFFMPEVAVRGHTHHNLRFLALAPQVEEMVQIIILRLFLVLPIQAVVAVVVDTHLLPVLMEVQAHLAS
jgi:hypothetical protein